MAGARCVHGGPLHIVGQVARLGYRGRDDFQHFLLALAHLVFQVDGRGGDKRVDAWALGVFHRFSGAGNVARNGAGQTGDHGVLGVLGNLAHRLKITFGGNREAGFDNVHAHLIESCGDFHLFVERHGGAGRLLTIAQGGVEDDHLIFVGVAHVDLILIVFAGARRFSRLWSRHTRVMAWFGFMIP